MPPTLRRMRLTVEFLQLSLPSPIALQGCCACKALPSELEVPT